MVDWNLYKENKPSKSGVYLISNEGIDPPLRACSYYDTIHGWTGIGHILEKVILYWSEFPTTPSFVNHVKVQSGTNYNQ
jgi:hypothetical protein